jgi:hypothetical protein
MGGKKAVGKHERERLENRTRRGRKGEQEVCSI